AIRGLTVLQGGLRGPLLPRMPSPRQNKFSPSGRLLRSPEREYEQQTLTGWLFAYLLLPLAIVRDWVLAPLYNDVFARLIDDYVLGQMRKRAIGLDLAGLELKGITDHPAAGLGSGPAGPFAECLAGASKDLVERTDRNALALVEAIR